MHSRIFQISEKPIKQYDYIDETFFCDHWFTDEIADYVNDETSRENDIEWFRNCHKNGVTVGEDENGKYFVVTDKHGYFTKAFEKFKTALENLSTATLDGFVEDKLHFDFYCLQSAYNDKYGFYICDCDCEYAMETMDEFIRFAKLGTKYYFGATIDYHF